MNTRALLVAATCCVLSTGAGATELTELWRTTGFVMPESVSYDPGTEAFYVGNINSPDMSANGAGYISKVGPDGAVIEEKFADGLNAPKGTYVADGKLYVAGVEEIAVIDLQSGEVTERLTAPGATFLNDVVVAEDGTIYATETMQGAIYVFADGAGSQWLVDPALGGANGIIIDGGSLLVATLGDISQGFDKLAPSNVKSVDIATKAVSDYGSDAGVGMLDGIELAESGVLVTDNGGGRLMRIATDGTATTIGDTGAGSADFEYVPDQMLVVVPILNSGELVGYMYHEE